MSPPTAQEQLLFLTKLQRLLGEGSFTASYKFALLLALAELAVEKGDDSGDALHVTLEHLAEKFVRSYWRQAAPYILPGGAGSILQQSTGKQAEILRRLVEAHTSAKGSLSELVRTGPPYQALVKAIARVVKTMPLFKLQRLGQDQDEFLYAHQVVRDGIELRPGVVFCLRQFYPLIEDLVRGAWLRFIRRLPGNQTVLGQAEDLHQFMFGSERADLSVFVPILETLQSGSCFYCAGALQRQGVVVDHFIPWSRYPIDLGHNFVLAHAACNAAKSDALATVHHLDRWWRRNDDHGLALRQAFDDRRVVHDLAASRQVTRWAYEAVERAGGQVWVVGKTYEPLGSGWRAVAARADASGPSA